MDEELINLKESMVRMSPTCPVFGECGGCAFQDIAYSDELKIKEQHLRVLLRDVVDYDRKLFDPIVASPQEYHYRHRLDLRLLKTRDQQVYVGFSPRDRFGVIEVEQCPIAMTPVSEFIPELKRQAKEVLPRKYRLANLVVRCGDSGEVRWGGIGKGSLNLNEEEYMWTEIYGRKIFFSLDTFFQANLSILPRLFEQIIKLPIWSSQTQFFDLYGGVGFFSLGLYDHYKQAHIVEDCKGSLKLAKYNLQYHQTEKITIREGRVEDYLHEFQTIKDRPRVAMIDPPRSGLSDQAREFFSTTDLFDQLLYLSCKPEALARDLKEFTAKQWKINKVIPFDFFPKTRHLETLVWMTPQ